MIDVAQDKTLASGATIRAALRLRWDEEFDETTVELHRTTFGGAAYGNRIVLRGRKQQRVLGEGEPYTLVEVEGTVPETVRPGAYACKYVRCLIPERGWVVLFEDIHDVTLRVSREPYVPPISKEGAQYLGLEI